MRLVLSHLLRFFLLTKLLKSYILTVKAISEVEFGSLLFHATELYSTCFYSQCISKGNFIIFLHKWNSFQKTVNANEFIRQHAKSFLSDTSPKEKKKITSICV